MSQTADTIYTEELLEHDVASGAESFREDGIDVHLDASGNPRIVERRFVVEEAFAGHRLDHYLKRQIPRLSRTKLQEIIRTQVQPVRGRTLKPSSPVMLGDEIVIRRPARPEPPCPRTFEVLYADTHMMVVDKPAGLAVHSSAKFYFNTLTRVLDERFPGQGWQICHRLDRETSGALVVARGREAAARLKGAFAEHKVRKTYLAVVTGQPTWPEGDQDGAPDADHAIDLPLRLMDIEDSPLNIRMEAHPSGLPARTLVRVVEQHPHCALVRCLPVTGRQHQIRAHMAATGHPIVGDKLYGQSDEVFARYCDEGLTPELLALFRLPRHALHAASIEVPHPEHGKRVRVVSPLPHDLRAYLDRRESDH